MIEGKDILPTDLLGTITALGRGERVAFKNVPEEIYHGAPGIGSTLLKAASRSMAHYKIQRDGPNQHKKEFDIGSALHCLVLEPELFAERFAAMPEKIDRRTKEGKAKWAEFEAENEGKTLLTMQDMRDVESMADAMLDNAGQFLMGGCSEVSYWVRHEATGLILKGRIDYQVGDAAIDIKTDKAETPDQFLRDVKYRYDFQDALYRKVSGLADMIFIGVGKAAPFPIFLCKQGEDVRARADEKTELLLRQIQAAEEFDEYPAFPVELMETHLSEWEKEATA